MKGKKCAICQSRITIDDITNVRFAPLAPIDGEQEKERFTKKKSLNAQYSIIPKEIQSQTIHDSYGTKIDTIIKHMLFLLQKDHTTKMILFSQEAKVLDICAIAMQRNDIQYVNLGGKKKDEMNVPRRFTENPEINILILNAKSQAAGLTLTAATHVFILEPQINASIEFQGIQIKRLLFNC